MRREPIFYSFHFDNDVLRVQQIRQMGVLDGNEPVSANDWESVRRRGDPAIEKWIDDNMKYTRCVVVLIGADTAKRPWVKYEIAKAWKERRGLFGIYIHNLKCPRHGTCAMGDNPFTNWNVANRSMADFISCHNPNSWDAYGDISRNLQSWVNTAIDDATRR